MDIILKTVLFFIIIFIFLLATFFFITTPVGALYVCYSNVVLIISLLMSCFGSMTYLFYINK
jgi:hypothetical protein